MHARLTVFARSSSFGLILSPDCIPSSSHPSSTPSSSPLPEGWHSSPSIISLSSRKQSSREAPSVRHLFRTAVVLSFDNPFGPRALSITSWTVPTLIRYSSPADRESLAVSLSRGRNIPTNDRIDSTTSSTTVTTSRTRVAPCIDELNSEAQCPSADVWIEMSLRGRSEAEYVGDEGLRVRATFVVDPWRSESKEVKSRRSVCVSGWKSRFPDPTFFRATRTELHVSRISLTDAMT